jgi:dipeptidyl aminopeptidase/acylaminoacyl peptidase
VDPVEAKIRAMGQIKRAWSPSFSPDGARLAFVSDAGELPEVYVVAAAGGTPERVTRLADPVGGVAWSPDGAWLALSVAPGGGMNQQIYLVRPDGKDLQRITDGGRDANWLGEWTRDGKALALASNRRDPAAMDAYLYEPGGKQLGLVAKNPGIGSLADVTRDRKRGLLTRSKSRGDNDLYLVDLTRGTERLLTRHAGPAQFQGRFSPDGKTVYVASNKDRDRFAFGKIAIGDGKQAGPIQIVAERADAELSTFAIGEHGVAALVWNVGGKSELALLELATGRPLPAPPLPREVLSKPAFSRDGKQLAVELLGPAAPRDIWVLEAGAWRQVTHSPHDGVDLGELVRPELVRFPAHDGLELSGWLYRPRGARGPRPLVLSFHGGPESQELPVLRGDYQALLAQGITVLAPNVRGSSGFGKQFMNADNGARRADAVKDIEACVSFVVGLKIADPRRLGIMGGSYGGYMTMAGVTEYPTMFAAAANLYGMVNFATFFKHTERWIAATSTTEYGDPATEAELLQRLSPIHKLDRIVTPVLVLHGQNDTNVPVIEAEQVVDHLKQRGVPVEYVLFTDEGHGWQKAENRIRSTVEITRWFDRHLNQGPGAGPGKGSGKGSPTGSPTGSATGPAPR